MSGIPPEAQELIARFNEEEATRTVNRPKKSTKENEELELRRVQDILNAAANFGCDIRDGKGSHKVIVKPDGTCMPIPVHNPGAELGKGLAHKICKFIRGK